MLVRFKVRNFKCFKNENTLSMVSKRYVSLRDEEINTKREYSLLRSVALYGANASGKSKLFFAFQFLKQLVKSSADETWYSDPISIDTFRLDEDSASNSSMFEVVFLIDSVQYRYGVELTKDEIIREWLFQKKKRETPVLLREKMEFECKKPVSDIEKAIREKGMLQERMLLLSALSQWNDSFAKKITTWFKKANVISSASPSFLGFSRMMLRRSEKLAIVGLMKGADLGIIDLEPHKADMSTIPDDIKKIISEEASKRSEKIELIDYVKSFRNRYNKFGEACDKIAFNLDVEESFGTYAFFVLAGPVIDTLINGKVLFIDEIDKGLHPNLVEALIGLFNDPTVNKKMLS